MQQQDVEAHIERFERMKHELQGKLSEFRVLMGQQQTTSAAIRQMETHAKRLNIQYHELKQHQEFMATQEKELEQQQDCASSQQQQEATVTQQQQKATVRQQQQETTVIQQQQEATVRQQQQEATVNQQQQETTITQQQQEATVTQQQQEATVSQQQQETTVIQQHQETTISQQQQEATVTQQQQEATVTQQQQEATVSQQQQEATVTQQQQETTVIQQQQEATVSQQHQETTVSQQQQEATVRQQQQETTVTQQQQEATVTQQQQEAVSTQKQQEARATQMSKEAAGAGTQMQQEAAVTQQQGETMDNQEEQQQENGVSNLSHDGEPMSNCRKHLLRLTLILIYFLINVSYSMMPAFFPKEALVMKITRFETGIIIGTSPLFGALTSPVMTYFLPYLGLRFTMVSGLWLLSGSCIIFSLTSELGAIPVFIAMCLLMRALEGSGSAAFVNASTTLIYIVYSRKARCISEMTTLASVVGFVVGPLVGATLYTIGGYKLPFLVIGLSLIVFAPIVCVLVPEVEPEKQTVHLFALSKLIRDIPFNLIVLQSLLSHAILAFFAPVYGHFVLQVFHIPVMYLGMIYFTGNSVYSGTSYIVGFLVGKYSKPRLYSCLGLSLAGVGLAVVGPSHFMTQHFSLYWTVTGYLISVLGSAFSSVPTISDLHKTSKEIDPVTSPHILGAIVSILTSTSFALGEFLGPTVGGALVDVTDFQTAALVIGELAIFQGAVIAGVTLIAAVVPILANVQ